MNYVAGEIFYRKYSIGVFKMKCFKKSYFYLIRTIPHSLIFYNFFDFISFYKSYFAASRIMNIKNFDITNYYVNMLYSNIVPSGPLFRESVPPISHFHVSHKIPKFHLISCCGKIVKTQIFCRVSGKSHFIKK